MRASGESYLFVVRASGRNGTAWANLPMCYGYGNTLQPGSCFVTCDFRARDLSRLSVWYGHARSFAMCFSFCLVFSVPENWSAFLGCWINVKSFKIRFPFRLMRFPWPGIISVILNMAMYCHLKPVSRFVFCDFLARDLYRLSRVYKK